MISSSAPTCAPSRRPRASASRLRLSHLPQSGLLDRAKDLYCSLPSLGGGVTAGGYAGLGGNVSGELMFDPQSGRIGVSAGLNVGVGVGFSVSGNGTMAA